MGEIYFTHPESEFGCIKEDRNLGGAHLFVHKTDIMNATPPPEPGDRVSYTVGEGTDWNRGKPVARNAHIERLLEERQGTDGRPGSSSGCPPASARPQASLQEGLEAPNAHKNV